MTTSLTPSNNFLLYTNQNGEVKVDVLIKDETIWLTINQWQSFLELIKAASPGILKISLKQES